MAGRSFRSLNYDADEELLEYLQSRNVSRHFLNEIDMFLFSHPEIAHSGNPFCQDFVNKINYSSPLEAYMTFVDGYTKPARYEDGVLREVTSLVPWETATQMIDSEDQELYRFFTTSGGEYRFDLLRKVDAEVQRIVYAQSFGARASSQEKRLVMLAVYGNAVDAYKFYEFSYQLEYLAHHYVPKHGVLLNVQKVVSEQDLRTYQLSYCLEYCEENELSYPMVRARMRGARQAGVDVVDVLISEYTIELARAGFSRIQIEYMAHEAKIDIRNQVDIRGHRDLVAMVMDRARAPQPQQEYYQPPLSEKLKIIELKYEISQLRTREATFYDEYLSAEESEILERRRSAERELVARATDYLVSNGSMSYGRAEEWRWEFVKEVQEFREENGEWYSLLDYF